MASAKSLAVLAAVAILGASLLATPACARQLKHGPGDNSTMPMGGRGGPRVRGQPGANDTSNGTMPIFCGNGTMPAFDGNMTFDGNMSFDGNMTGRNGSRPHGGRGGRGGRGGPCFNGSADGNFTRPMCKGTNGCAPRFPINGTANFNGSSSAAPGFFGRMSSAIRSAFQGMAHWG